MSATAAEVDALLRALDALHEARRLNSNATVYSEAAAEIRRLQEEVGNLQERAHVVDASITCAAMGHYKRGEPMHDDYKTVGLSDVLNLRDKWSAAEARCAELELEIASDWQKDAERYRYLRVGHPRCYSLDDAVDAAIAAQTTAATPDTLTTGPAQAGAAGSAATKGERKG